MKKFVKILSVFSVLCLVVVCGCFSAFAEGTSTLPTSATDILAYSRTYQRWHSTNGGVWNYLDFNFSTGEGLYGGVPYPQEDYEKGWLQAYNFKTGRSYSQVQVGISGDYPSGGYLMSVAPGDTVCFEGYIAKEDPWISFDKARVEFEFRGGESVEVQVKNFSRSTNGKLGYFKVFWTNKYNYTAELIWVRAYINNPITWTVGVPPTLFFGLQNVTYRGLNDSEKQIIATENLDNTIKESTDAILNGYDSSPDKPSGSDSVNDLGSAEEDLLNGAQSGIEETESVFESVVNGFNEYKNAIFAVSALLTSIFSIPIFSFLLYVSLALGVVLLLFNLASSVIGRSRAEAQRKEDRQIRNDYYKAGNDYYKAGTEYYNSRKR